MINETLQKSYHMTQTERDIVLQRLKERGCRITRQRLILLDIILDQECSCCKEIYYRASKQDAGIGIATVYRMINMLEEIGVISRKNMYKITCSPDCKNENGCQIQLENNSVLHLSEQEWNRVVKAGLSACGYIKKSS